MTQAAALDACHWREPGGAAAARVICSFLAGIGVELEVGPFDGPDLLPGLAVRRGSIRIDPSAEVFPGDLLHEAGHIAVTAPELRATLDQVGDDPGEEMAAIAWSVAAARACGVPLEVLFHPEGYKGGSAAMLAAFADNRGPGIPMLGWYGLGEIGAFPAMTRWLR